MKSFTSVAAAFMLQVALTAGANLCQTTYEDYQQLCGEAIGDFQMLGSLCFPGSDVEGEKHHATISFALTFDGIGTLISEEQLQHYYIFIYDDQQDSFPAINRITEDGDPQTCTERQASALGCSSANCTNGAGFHLVSTKHMTVNGELTTYSKNITIAESYAREWYFVLSACGITSPIKLHSYTVSSDDATDCASIYEHSDAGYIAAVVILTLAMVALGVVSYIFYKRTKIPELLSMDDTGYNEL